MTSPREAETETEFEARVAVIRARLERLGFGARGVDLDSAARHVAVAPPLSDEQRAMVITLMAQRRVATP